MLEQDKDPRVQENHDQRKVPKSTGDARSAFRPLRDNGGLSPFVPRPGPLQRDLHAQMSEVWDIPEISVLLDELMPQTKCHLELLQLPRRLLVTKEVETANLIPLLAAPQVLKDGE